MASVLLLTSSCPLGPICGFFTAWRRSGIDIYIYSIHIYIYIDIHIHIYTYIKEDVQEEYNVQEEEEEDGVQGEEKDVQ